MTSGEDRSFQARLADLPETALFVENFASVHGIDHDDALRLTLIVEELFTNAVTHGYGGDCDAAIRIALCARAGEIQLYYEDAAPRYDPLSRLSQSPADGGARDDSQPIGGLGIPLVRHLTGSARYVYEDRCNRLWLTLRRRS